MRFIAMRFNRDHCMQIAASLTFTMLLSQVPLLTITLAVFSAFSVFKDFSSQIKAYMINNLMPNMAGKIITQYMRQLTESAMHLMVVGIAFLAVTAMLTIAPLLIGASLSLTSCLVVLQWVIPSKFRYSVWAC